MIFKTAQQTRNARYQAAFTLVEVLIATCIVGITFVSLYTGISAGFGVVSVARESLRATQIMLEKSETLRLYNWSQLNTTGFIPTNFTAPYYPPIGTNTNTGGLTYYGNIAITKPPITESYSNDLRQVVITVTWTNGQVRRVRSMQTFVSRYGLQNYIY